MPRPKTSSTLIRRLELLQRIPRAPGKVAASALCDALAEAGFVVSKRTIERDLAELAMHFPLTADERNTPFGWSWSKAAPAITLAHLSTAHALALMTLEKHAAKLLPPWALEELAPFVTLARNQVNASASSHRINAWLEKQIVVPSSMPLIAPKIRAEVLATCQQALFEERRLEITYRKKRENTLRRAAVAPHAICHRGIVTYLFCVFDGYDDMRMLPLHRIDTAEVLDVASTKLIGSLSSYVERATQFGLSTGDKILLVATFTREAASHLEETPLSTDQSLTPTKNGGVEVRATVLDSPQLRWWLLGFAENVTVKSPISLRDEMAERAENMLARYRRNSVGKKPNQKGTR
jgi:predicted DNA-binding transcriptional regulator YafY